MSFVKSAAITFASNLLLFFVSIATAVITSRLLGPSGRGILGVANNLLTFATLSLGLGMAASSVYFVGRQRDKVGRIIGNNGLVALMGIFLLIPFYFINAHYHFPFLRGLDNRLMVIALLAVPLINFKSTLLNILLGLQEIVDYNRLNIMDKSINLALLIAFIAVSRSPASALLSTLTGAIVVCSIEVYILTSRMGYRVKLDPGILRGMLGYGLKAQLGNVIQWLNYRLDVFIVNFFLPISQVGVYTTAVPLGETLWQVSGSIATLIFPIASASRDRRQSAAFTNQVTRISFALIVLLSLALAGVSRPLILLLFGRAFSGAVGALLWLLPGICIFSVSNILANFLAGQGQLEKNIFSSFLSAVATVVLDLYLVPRLGINGASIATSISYIVFTLTTLFFYCRFTDSRWQDTVVLKKEDAAMIRKAVASKLRRNKS